jgi:predicted PurR-regulated permease PerM
MNEVESPEARPAARVEPPDVPGLRGLTTLLSIVVAIGALYFGRPVLIPVTLAVLLSFLVAPLVALLRRAHLGQVLSVMLSVALSLVVILSIGAVIGTQVATLATDLPRYQTTIKKKIDAVEGLTIGTANGLTQRIRRALEPRDRNSTSQLQVDPPLNRNEKPPMPVEVHAPRESPLEIARRLISPVVGPLETTGIVLVVAIFILLQRGDLRDRLIRLFGSRDLHRTTTALDETAGRLSRYFLAQLAINASVGGFVAAGLLIIGVPGAGLFGVLAALLRFVPYVGLWIAATMAICLGAAVDPGWGTAIWTLALFGAIDVIAAQVVEPLAYGRSTGLSPFAVIVAAIFWSWIWGPLGLILSTPLTLCLVILGRHVDRLEFLDVLLSDRPALTPAENFYQRILANDPDEALAQAEVLLRTMSLTGYYERVALPGLRLAANDIARGVVTDKQMGNIRQAAAELVAGLSEFVDKHGGLSVEDDEALSLSGAEQAIVEAAPRESEVAAVRAVDGPPPTVVCISGRNALDEILTSITVQLLEKHALQARHIVFEATSRARFTKVDLSDAALVCIVSLDSVWAPSYLRYLRGRVMQRAPHAQVVVGMRERNTTPSSGRGPASLAAPVADESVAAFSDLIAQCAQLAPVPARPAPVEACTIERVAHDSADAAAAVLGAGGFKPLPQ